MNAVTWISSIAHRCIALLRRLLDRSNYVIQLVIFYLLSYALVILYIPLVALSDTIAGQGDSIQPKNAFAAVFLAPVLETLMNQVFVYWLLSKIAYFRSRPWLIVFISAVLFGMMHWYNLGYIIFAFTLGLLFMCIYMYYLPNYSKAFWSTALIHFARNLTAVLLADYFK